MIPSVGCLPQDLSLRSPLARGGEALASQLKIIPLAVPLP